MENLVDIALTTARGRRLVVLIDGRSGAGKTTLAQKLSAQLAERLGRPIQTVSLDDVYPGWHGLAAGEAAVPKILANVDPGYRRYDWAQGRQTDWVELSPIMPIVVEGVGALTPRSAQKATLRIWLDGPEAVRRQAVVDRDGSVDDWWDDWAAQEQSHIKADAPISLADIVITGITPAN